MKRSGESGRPSRTDCGGYTARLRHPEIRRVTDYRTQAGYIRVGPHKPMSDWIDIHYREYWDLPRMVIATGPGGTFLFWSRFDEELDEYIDHYEVWRMPPLSESDLSGSWVGLEGKALERMPDVPLRELPFIITSPNAQSHDPTVGV
jgi:hypothetical protein